MKSLKCLIVGFCLSVVGIFPASADSLRHDVFIFCDGDARTLTIELALAWDPVAPDPETKNGQLSLSGKANISSVWRLQDPKIPRRSVALSQTQISEFSCVVPVNPENLTTPSKWYRARAEIREDAGNANPNGRCGSAPSVWARLTWLTGANKENLHSIERQLINRCNFGTDNLPIRKIIMNLTNGEVIEEVWPAAELP